MPRPLPVLSSLLTSILLSRFAGAGSSTFEAHIDGKDALQVLGIVLPFTSAEVELVRGNLRAWQALGRPACGAGGRAQHVQLVLYYHRSQDLSVAAQLQPEVDAVAGHFGAGVMWLWADLQPEQDVYPEGANTMFNRLLIPSPAVRAGTSHLGHVFWMETDAFPLRQCWLDALAAEAAAGAGSGYWVRGSGYLGAGLDSAAAQGSAVSATRGRGAATADGGGDLRQPNWRWLGHVNGNALYRLHQPQFESFLRDVRDWHGAGPRDSRAWQPWDLAAWAWLHTWPHNWRLFQAAAHRFQRTTTIANLGSTATAADFSVARAGPGGPHVVHGRPRSAGALAQQQQQQQVATAGGQALAEGAVQHRLQVGEQQDGLRWAPGGAAVPAGAVGSRRKVSALLAVCGDGGPWELRAVRAAVRSVRVHLPHALDVVVVVPEASRAAFADALAPAAAVVVAAPAGMPGHVIPAYAALHADDFCPGAAAVMALGDGTWLLNRTLFEEDVFRGGRPLEFVDGGERGIGRGSAPGRLSRWDDTWEGGNDATMQSLLSTGLGFGLARGWRFGCAPAPVYPRALFAPARARLQEAFGVPVADLLTRLSSDSRRSKQHHPRNGDGSMPASPFPTHAYLGAYAYHFFPREKLHWVRQDSQALPALSAGFVDAVLVPPFVERWREGREEGTIPVPSFLSDVLESNGG